MYVAYDNKDEVCNALDSDIKKTGEYYCPICKGKVIFKKGIKIQSHFAHAKNCSCEYETYKKESSEHLATKKDLYEHFKGRYRNVEVEHIFKTESSIQIADVYIKDNNVAFEYQRSVIPYELIEERTKGYSKAGIKLIWLIDTKKFIKELKNYDGISYIRYAPFVDNFLNYYQGKVFFYGWNNEDKKFEFYQIWAHNLKKRNAVCIKTSYDIRNFDVPLDLQLLDKDLTSKLYPEDIKNYVYEQLKYDKTIKNKVLSMFYNQKIELNNIPDAIGINMLEQVLIQTPLVYWQGLMYRFFKEGKTYSELIRIMSNIIEFKNSIYINNVQRGEIFLKVFKEYYKLLVEKED
ncbi:competence protein CoiA [Gemella cuniculi]|uniref:competence protein CoiA n=1 Tax=Gemella cuniculi TaxID=150240 RepID=UPI00041DBCD7|nr:competence protein CoiA family protein [Gemella cuniculi]